ncbi:MAG: DJ-1/PfpI family protein [Actinomycetota bacterium]|nr:DJ-1/PfpI family protein [Actinomycetota bacterium]
MADDLTGKTIAFVLDNSGVEEVELTAPCKALQAAGATTVLIAPESGTVQAFTNDVEKAGTYDATLATADASAADYDGLVIPGGTTNADSLRLDEPAKTCPANGWTRVTSRNPDDLEAFCAAAIEAFSG